MQRDGQYQWYKEQTKPDEFIIAKNKRNQRHTGQRNVKCSIWAIKLKQVKKEQEEKSLFNREQIAQLNSTKKNAKGSIVNKNRASASAQRQRKRDNLDIIEQQRNETILFKSFASQKIKNEKKLANFLKEVNSKIKNNC